MKKRDFGPIRGIIVAKRRTALNDKPTMAALPVERAKPTNFRGGNRMRPNDH